MKRREFITLLGGAAAAWPLAVRAQQGDRVRRIGVLQAIGESDPEAQLRKMAFVGGLQKFGWTEGTNVMIDYRWAGGDADRIRLYATELTGMRPDVIWTSGALPLLPLKRATRTIPIIFTQIYDPVGSGFVASLTRPGGNITGFTLGEFSMGGKTLEVLKEVAPRVGHDTCYDILQGGKRAKQIVLLKDKSNAPAQRRYFEGAGASHVCVKQAYVSWFHPPCSRRASRSWMQRRQAHAAAGTRAASDC
jgi:ABC transporter substrate binding protein